MACQAIGLLNADLDVGQWQRIAFYCSVTENINCAKFQQDKASLDLGLHRELKSVTKN